MNLPTIALSIRQPWAWLILYAGKDVENRSWETKFRGRVLIHAGKGMTRAEYEDAFYPYHGQAVPCLSSADFQKPSFDQLSRGGIVGSVEIVDCVWRSPSPWFIGRYGFVLRDPLPLPFHPCKGQLGFFPCVYPEVHS